jgi:hypothetical protein
MVKGGGSGGGLGSEVGVWGRGVGREVEKGRAVQAYLCHCLGSPQLIMGICCWWVGIRVGVMRGDVV